MSEGALYPFTDHETGEIRNFDFETMMGADVIGSITVEGREYRRVRQPFKMRSTGHRFSAEKKIVSDAMGFSAEQVGAFEEDRKANGFNGVEFKPDPLVPEFYQVHCDNYRVWERYVKHRSFADMNSRNGSGAMISKEQMEAAKEIASRKK